MPPQKKVAFSVSLEMPLFEVVDKPVNSLRSFATTPGSTSCSPEREPVITELIIRQTESLAEEDE